LLSSFRHIINYDGYIDTNLLSNKNTAHIIQDIILAQRKERIPTAPLAVPMNNIEYKPCTPKNIIVFGGATDKLRGSEKYKQVFSKLAEQGYLKAYGPKTSWVYLGKNYHGLLEESGEDLINKIRESCIGLAIHASEHLDAGIPTTRILEIIASGAIAISDQNSFIEKHFGNNVLYFDHTQPADIMEKEIIQHLHWIRENPDLARVKAQNAHEIFVQNFTTEQFLDDVWDLHEQVEDSKMNSGW
jgi:hypothetical protein